jgi:TRAP-type C4-dicarboxylate transport system substrate-binding protein
MTRSQTERMARRLARWALPVAVAAILVTTALPPDATAQTIAFKCSTATLNDVQHEWCKRFGARLEKRTNGRIKPQVFPASQLGSIPRQIEGVQLGTIESWIGPPEFMVGVDARFQVLTAPYLFDGFDQAHRVINDPEFLDKFLVLAEGKGIRGVSLIVYGPASFVARAPIRTPDDLRGKKIRVLATPIESAMMAQVGATGVPMTLGEVLPALQQGALDGVQSALTVFTTFKYYDVARFHTNTDHYFITSIGTVSKKWLEGLPADIQKVVLEEGRAVHAELLDWTKNFYQTGVKTWKEKTRDGWVELTADQRAAFRARLEGVDAAVAEKVPGIKEWLDLLRAKAKATR